MPNTSSWYHSISTTAWVWYIQKYQNRRKYQKVPKIPKRYHIERMQTLQIEPSHQETFADVVSLYKETKANFHAFMSQVRLTELNFSKKCLPFKIVCPLSFEIQSQIATVMRVDPLKKLQLFGYTHSDRKTLKYYPASEESMYPAIDLEEELDSDRMHPDLINHLYINYVFIPKRLSIEKSKRTRARNLLEKKKKLLLAKIVF